VARCRGGIGAGELPANAFAHAHRANHPPGGVAPNAMLLAHDYAPDTETVRGQSRDEDPDASHKDLGDDLVDAVRDDEVSDPAARGDDGAPLLSPRQLRALLPNQYVAPPMALGSRTLTVANGGDGFGVCARQMRGLVLVLTRDVADGESRGAGHRDGMLVMALLWSPHNLPGRAALLLCIVACRTTGDNSRISHADARR